MLWFGLDRLKVGLDSGNVILEFGPERLNVML